MRAPPAPDTVLTHLLLLSLCLLMTPACGEGPYGPPPVPLHDVMEEGHLHARGHDTPYLCVSADFRVRESCPTGVELPLDRRSCDSAGCHGTHETTQSSARAPRDLGGDEGPSCWSCHDREWSDRKE